MSTLHCRFALISALMLAPLSAGCATPSAPRAGFNVGLGWTAMTADFTCAGCTLRGDSDDWEGDSGLGGYFRMGLSVSERILLGAEVGVQATGEQGRSHIGERSSEIFDVLLTGQYYVHAVDGLHVTGAVGPSHFRLLTNSVGSHAGDGLMTRIGAGYDWHVKGRFAVTPHLNLSRLDVRNFTTHGSVGPATDIGIRWMAQLGLGLNWY